MKINFLDFVIINAFTKFDWKTSINSQLDKLLSMNKISTSIKGHNSVEN